MRLKTSYVAMVVAASLALPPPATAESHLVTETEIGERVQAAAAERAANALRVERFLTRHLPAAAHGSNVQRLRVGVAALSDDELRDLATRADALQTDPVATGLVKTLIIVGLVVLIIVLLAAAIVENCKEQGAECLN
jgi:hypothetical protein